MYKIEWDPETGGVCLNSRITDKTLGISPRPVFWEELDLLKMVDFGWVYPHSEEPLLWACNKKYYYRGELVFEVKGANIYDSPVVLLEEGKDNLSIKPIDVELMLERCKNEMFIVESEAIEFIHDTYLQYASARKALKVAKSNELDFEAIVARQEKKTKKKMAIVKEDCESFDIVPLEEAEKQGKKVYKTTKIDIFLASFSGGKDSQVVLDLCTRAIPSTEFEVIYSDTGYELPPSLELYEEVQRYYKERFPDLKFSTARNHDSVLNYWDKIGTPSDKHRWCCAIMKTAPLYRMLKTKDNKQARVLAFEGVRSEESALRANYDRIGRGVKHESVINARPILNWNTTEIFLYLFKTKLPINQAYRFGKPRVGCLICPFSSPWDDMIVNKKYPNELKPFLDRLIDLAKQRNIPNLDEYIKDHKWKLRASGNSLSNKTSVIIKQQNPSFVVSVKNSQKSLEIWLPVLCDYTYVQITDKHKKGELRFNKAVYDFEIIIDTPNCYTFTLFDARDINLISLLRRVIYKSAYCIHCEACEVECPTGALSVYPEIKINKQKCIHCHKCLQFHDNGCIVANSLIMNVETTKKNGSISRIGTFGIHEEWLQEFLLNPVDFWQDNSLGNKQEQSFKAWLIDADIIDSKKQLTKFGEFCVNNYIDQPILIWELIWVNFAYSSTLVSWFINKIKKEETFNKAKLDEFGLVDFDGTRNTITYAMGGFLQIFTYSPIGRELYQGVEISNRNFLRTEHTELSEISLAYSIYKYAEYKGIKSLRVSDFYDEYCEYGPVKEFLISKANFEKLLRKLNSMENRTLIAELNMGLDNITLRDDLSSMDILKILVQ